VGVRTNITISAACSVVIEDDVVFGGSVTVVDSDHSIAVGAPAKVVGSTLGPGTPP
jgi:acetyltransferase-like isoleucine patch superfamily enzyme